MIQVQVTIHSKEHGEEIDQWFKDHRCPLVGVMGEGLDLSVPTYAVESESISDHMGRGSRKIDFTDDLEDVAMLFKLTWGGR